MCMLQWLLDITDLSVALDEMLIIISKTLPEATDCSSSKAQIVVTMLYFLADLELNY